MTPLRAGDEVALQGSSSRLYIDGDGGGDTGQDE